MKQVTSIKHLKELADTKDKDPQEFLIRLGNGGMYSRKTIYYNKKKDMFYVTNHIDNSEQVLSPRQLNSKSYTNIGEAIKKKALVYEPN